MRDFLFNWAYGFFMYMLGCIVMNIHMRHTEKTIELIPTAKQISLETLEQIKVEIETELSNLEKEREKIFLGDNSAVQDSRNYGVLRGTTLAKELTLKIIDKAIKEQNEWPGQYQ